jgi:aspartyl-tRNA(Asn)/glutamyl-tRNA(Gln) amidotransferase subunit C
MSVDIKTVRRIARLARIGVSDKDSDLEPMTKELNAILSWVEQLNELDTDNVDPMTSAVEATLTLRDDKVTDGGYPERVFANAPDQRDDYFVVPRVVE